MCVFWWRHCIIFCFTYLAAVVFLDLALPEFDRFDFPIVQNNKSQILVMQNANSKYTTLFSQKKLTCLNLTKNCYTLYTIKNTEWNSRKNISYKVLYTDYHFLHTPTSTHNETKLARNTKTEFNLFLISFLSHRCHYRRLLREASSWEILQLWYDRIPTFQRTVLPLSSGWKPQTSHPRAHFSVSPTFYPTNPGGTQSCYERGDEVKEPNILFGKQTPTVQSTAQHWSFFYAFLYIFNSPCGDRGKE
jgi:hypothetical protein